MRRKKGHKKLSNEALNVASHSIKINLTKNNDHEHIISSSNKLKLLYKAMKGILNISNEDATKKLSFIEVPSSASTLIHLDDSKSNVEVGGRNIDSHLMHFQEVIDRFVYKTQNLQVENNKLVQQVKKLGVELNTINENLEKERNLNQVIYSQCYKCKDSIENHCFWMADSKLDTSINESLQIEDDKYVQDQKKFQIEILGLKIDQNIMLNNLQSILEERKSLENNLTIALDEHVNLKRQLDTFITDNRTLREFNEELNKKIENLQLQIQNLEICRNTLTKSHEEKISENQNYKDRLGKTQVNNVLLRESLIKSQNENDFLIGRLEKEEHKKRYFHKNVLKLKIKNEELIKNLQKLKNITIVLCSEFEKSGTEIIIQKESLDKSELEKSSFNEILSKLKMEWDLVRENFQISEDAKLSGIEKIRILESEKKISQSIINNYQHDLTVYRCELEKCKEKIILLQIDVETSQDKNIYFQENNYYLKDEIKSLERIVDILQIDRDKSQENVQEVDEFIKSIDVDYDPLNLEKKGLKNKIIMLQDQSNNIIVDSRLNALMIEKRESESAIFVASSKIDDLLKKLDICKQIIIEYRSKVNLLTLENEKISSINNNLIIQNDLLKDFAKKKEFEIADLEDETKENEMFFQNKSKIIDVTCADEESFRFPGEVLLNDKNKFLMDYNKSNNSYIKFETILNNEYHEVKTIVKEVVEELIYNLQSKYHDNDKLIENACGGLPMLVVESPKSYNSSKSPKFPILSQYSKSPKSLELLYPQITSYSYPTYNDNEVQVSLEMNILYDENNYLANANRLEKEKYYKSIVYLIKNNCELESQLSSLQANNVELQEVKHTVEKKLEMMEAIIKEDVLESNVYTSQLIEVKNALSHTSKVNQEESRKSMSAHLETCNESKAQFYKKNISTREIMLAIVVAFVGALAVRLYVHAYATTT